MRKSFTEKLLPWQEILPSELFENDINKEKFKNAIVQTRTGSLIAIIKLNTRDYLLSQTVLRNRRDTFSDFLSRLEENYAVYFSIFRSSAASCYHSHEKEMKGSARIIEKERSLLFSGPNSFESSVYISISYTCSKSNMGISTLIFNEFLETLDCLLFSIRNIDACPHILKGNEIINFLRENLCFSKYSSMLPPENIPLSEALDTAVFSLNSIPLMVKEDKEEVYVRTLSFNTLPEYTFPDMLRDLYSIPFALHAVFKYVSLGKEKGENTIVRRRKQYRSSIFSITDHMKAELTGGNVHLSGEEKEGAREGSRQCSLALEAMHQEGLGVGFFTASIIAFSNSEEETENNIAEIKSYINRMGFLAKVETIGNSLLFFSSIPGFEISFRAKLVLSKNFADMLHLSSAFEGARCSHLLMERTGSSTPLVYAKNLDSSPYYFSLSGKWGEKGHTFISGPTGSGKSVLLALIVAQWQKYKNTRTVIIDRDLSSLNVVLNNGGRVYFPLFDGTSFKPISPKKSERNACLEFLKAVCFSGGISWNTALQKDAEEALSLLSSEHETINDFYALLKGINPASSLVTALSPYIKGGIYESLFASSKDNFSSFDGITLIETSRIFPASSNSMDGVSLPIMIHILSRLERAFKDGVPTLLIIDEAWKLLKNDIFKNFIEEWIKTLRKFNVDVIFSITNINDIVHTSIAETVLSNTETRIFMSDKSALETIQRRNYESLGLSEKEINLIKHAPSFCPLVLSDSSLSIVDFQIDSQLEHLVTTQKMKREYLCEKEQ